MRTLCKYKGVEILQGYLMPNHVHLVLSIPPKLSVSSFMRYLKGKSALMMLDKHANLKYTFGNRHFWSEGYYVTTVGLNEETIRKYGGILCSTPIIGWKDTIISKNNQPVMGLCSSCPKHEGFHETHCKALHVYAES